MFKAHELTQRLTMHAEMGPNWHARVNNLGLCRVWAELETIHQ